MEPIDPGAILGVCLCHSIRRGGRLLTRLYDRALARGGLTAGQFTILAAVAASEPTPVPVLRELLAMDRTSLSRTLKPLEKLGLIDIRAGTGRRPGMIRLTADGAASLRDAGLLWRAAQAEASERLGTGRTGQLLAALTAVAAVLGD